MWRLALFALCLSCGDGPEETFPTCEEMEACGVQFCEEEWRAAGEACDGATDYETPPGCRSAERAADACMADACWEADKPNSVEGEGAQISFLCTYRPQSAACANARERCARNTPS